MVGRCKNCGGLISADAIDLVTMSDEEKRVCECTAESFPRLSKRGIKKLQTSLAEKTAEIAKLKERIEDLINELHPDKGCYSCYHPNWVSDRDYSYLYCHIRTINEPQKKHIRREECWKKVEPNYKHYEELVKKIKEYEQNERIKKFNKRY